MSPGPVVDYYTRMIVLVGMMARETWAIAPMVMARCTRMIVPVPVVDYYTRMMALTLMLAFMVWTIPSRESFAAFEGIVVDSKSAAMGDCWSASQHGLHFLAPVPPVCENLSACVIYCAPFGLPELGQKTVLVNLPMRSRAVSLVVLERGSSLYKETSLTASISDQVFPSARIGLSVSALSMSIDGFGQERFFVLGAGVRARPVRSLEACVGLGNLTSTSFSDSDRGAVPSTFLLGMSLKPRENVTAAGEVRKRPGEVSSFHVGLELEPQKGIGLRCGLQTLPVELTLGIAIALGPMSIETATSFHAVLGRTDTITLTFRRGKTDVPRTSSRNGEPTTSASTSADISRNKAHGRQKE